MRCVAGVGLFALVGCNQVFGINPTRTYDASIDVPPDQPHVLLNWQIATVIATDVPGGASSGAPDPLPTFAAIDPPPRLRIAPLTASPGAADPNPALGAFQPADYLPILMQEPGAIAIPREDVTRPWRLEYTLTDNIPHEVQWLPGDKQGHLTVPVFGRLDREPAPVGGGYTIVPENGPGTYTAPRVFTTGLWTEGVVSPLPTTSKIEYDFAAALTLSGPTGRPDATRGDRALVVDFESDSLSLCRFANGSAPIAPATIDSGAHSQVTPTWDASRKDVKTDAVPGDALTRLSDHLGGLGKLDMDRSQLLFGSAAHPGMPGLTGTRTVSKLGQLVLPVPVMTPLLQCPAFTQPPLPRTAQPGMLDDFPRVLHVQLVASRLALGVTLASGLETTLESSAAAADTVGFKIAFPAPLATQIQLATPQAGVVALDGADEQVAIGPASGTFVLRFTPEVGPNLRADYHEVRLHQISGGALITQRIYTVTAPSVLIDGALLVPGADYVFEIRTYKGHPRAQQGDFAPVDYPYGAAIVFTRTFRAS